MGVPHVAGPGRGTAVPALRICHLYLYTMDARTHMHESI